MGRGTTLANLRAMLKAEVGEATETNDFADAEYNLLLATKQKDLANAYDWSFLRHQWDLTCAIGSRYLDIPTTDTRSASVSINFARPVLVERYFNGAWAPVDYGITNDHYTAVDSATGETQDPIQRWQISTNTSEAANADEIEVWPSPATAQTLRFTGQRTVLALTSDAHKADLDDQLIVYFVAAERLLLRQQASADYKLTQAQQHLIRLRAGYPTGAGPIVLGQNLIDTRRRDRPIIIAAG